MGARWARGTMEDLANNLNGVAVSAVPEITTEMTEIAERGKADMQRRISEAHTRTGIARVASGRGEHAGRRVEDVMFDAVEARVSSPVPNVVNAEMGWLDKFLAYFGYQERGTTYIPAMYALRDSSEIMRNEVKQFGRDYMADIKSRIGF